ncbi:MAG: biotin transporter BioY [Candidatus Gastranaerophilales bacterium]|nr:biotin transporter BioY [Candidatus Gastranaerophilales bacterium]
MKIEIKHIIKKIKKSKIIEKYPKLNFGSILVVFLSFLFITMSTFTRIPLFHLAMPEGEFLNFFQLFGSEQEFSDFIKYFYYIPQIPVTLMVGAILGPSMGVFAVLIYIIAGLFGLPIFASGGGISYVANSGFGYILGYLFGVFFSSKILRGKFSFKKLLFATISGILWIHIVGIIYMSIVLLIKQQPFISLFGWIWVVTGMQILYDLIFSFITLYIGRFIKVLLWPIME